MGSRKCSDKRCHVLPEFTLRATYRFPAWFAAKLVYISMANSTSGPSFGISVQRIVPHHSPTLLQSIAYGDLCSIQRAFSSGLATPNDIASSDGRTLLHFALGFRQCHISEFLLKAGANVHLQVNDELSPLVSAWMIILHDTPQNMVRTEDLQALFPQTEEVVEAFSFPMIHQIALGFKKTDLEQYLRYSTDDINAKDAIGWTALFWALVRQDEATALTLIRFNADVNVSMAFGTVLNRGPLGTNWRDQASPRHLIHAFLPRCAHPTLFQLLVDAGVDVTLRNAKEQTALHLATEKLDGEVYLPIFRGLPFDVNSRNYLGRTPLHIAAFKNPRSFRWLLDNGADVEAVDVDGDTPLLASVGSDFFTRQAFQCLLEHGANYLHRNNLGESVLHKAASLWRGLDTWDFDGLRALDILTTARLRGLDVNWRDIEGRTAMQVLRARVLMSPSERYRDMLAQWYEDEFYEDPNIYFTPSSHPQHPFDPQMLAQFEEAFQQLLDSVAEHNEAESICGSDDDLFFDCHEEQGCEHADLP
ncbi:ankyrin [Trichodelitschia bisporula]|uniref:Ankyrin n=1 Tax=Trichodelitschia bisporula TaxID=703511 RepID=A0A6G1HKF3_9PEZI|nr:ankyrin [Trichodelitschia bisporula]